MEAYWQKPATGLTVWGMSPLPALYLVPVFWLMPLNPQLCWCSFPGSEPPVLKEGVDSRRRHSFTHTNEEECRCKSVWHSGLLIAPAPLPAFLVFIFKSLLVPLRCPLSLLLHGGTALFSKASLLHPLGCSRRLQNIHGKGEFKNYLKCP